MLEKPNSRRSSSWVILQCCDSHTQPQLLKPRGLWLLLGFFYKLEISGPIPTTFKCADPGGHVVRGNLPLVGSFLQTRDRQMLISHVWNRGKARSWVHIWCFSCWHTSVTYSRSSRTRSLGGATWKCCRSLLNLALQVSFYRLKCFSPYTPLRLKKVKQPGKVKHHIALIWMWLRHMYK